MIKTVSLFHSLKKSIPKSDICSVIKLLGELGCVVKIDCDYNCIEFSELCKVEYTKKEDLFEDSDLIVVMGGDGSIIEAARLSFGKEIPIVGINFGNLGYLAEIEFGELELLGSIIKGEYTVEDRMMFDISIERKGETIKAPKPCLNEIVLSNGPISRLSGFDLYCDGIHVSKYAADGIIISTPTGSSAYSMSAGGPLIYQTMECICTTPVCPHSMTLKPVVFKGDAVIEIKNASCRGNSMFITIDGRDNIEIFSDDTVKVEKSSFVTKLVRVRTGGFVNVLRRKMSDMCL